jgi:hypothetical protein
LASHQKKAAKLKSHIVFIDESGMLMAPLVRRTWSPRGQTPILYQKTCSHKKVSVIAALCISPRRNLLSMYFRLHPDADINAVAIVAFLRCLLKELPGHIVIVWDRFQPHRSKKVQKLLGTNARLHLDFFPPYAPELNPVEYVWAHTKMNPMANMTAMELDALTTSTRGNMRSLQKKQPLLRSFFKKCGLSLRLK